MSQPLRVLDLFSGIGGFSLGLERAGMQTVAFCEIDPFCRRVLSKHWPDVPIQTDIRQIQYARFVDVICGGFPCQPFSTASRGRRVAEDFWPEMMRVIRLAKPRYIIAENVSAQAIAKATADLRREGYATYDRRISGADCGADHQRDRWWAFAYPDAESEFCSSINAEVAKLPSLCAGLWGAENYSRAIRVPDGISNRMDRSAVEALGNAVIPQIPEAIGRAIIALGRRALAESEGE